MTNKKKEPVITIEYGDWLAEYEASAVKPTSQDDIIAAMQETDLKPTQAARLAIVAREQGKADDDILPPNKVALMLGGSYKLSQIIAHKRKTVQANGREYETRQYVGTVPEDEVEEGEYDATAPAVQYHGSGKTLVEVGDPESVERATRYLLEVVPGYIESRLILIAAGSGDVKDAAEKLKKRIDDLVAELV